jgi:hypothetical protein
MLGYTPWNKGKKMRPRSEEYRRKLSEANKGVHPTEETRKKLSESHKGIRLSEETKRKLSEGAKGRVFTDEHKRNISEAAKRRPPVSDDVRERRSKASKGKTMEWMRGENNKQWKGDEAGIISLHRRIYWRRGQPKKCEVCGIDKENKRYEWANLTGKYHDISDYKRMCVPCHKIYDRVKKVANLFFFLGA